MSSELSPNPQGRYRLLEGQEIVLAIRAQPSTGSPLHGADDRAAQAARAITGVAGAVSIGIGPGVGVSDFTFTSTNLQLAGGSIGLRAGDFSRADYNIPSIEDCLLVRLQAADDNIADSGERLRLQLLNADSGADRIRVLGHDGSAMPPTAVLADSNPVVEIVIEEPVRYTVRAEPAIIEEDRDNDGRGNEVAFAVAASPAPMMDEILYYRLSGTATPNEDYAMRARSGTTTFTTTFPSATGPDIAVGTLTFQRGSREQELQLTTIPDPLFEGNETIILHLYAAGENNRAPYDLITGSFADAAPIAATANATLTDNDPVTASVARAEGAPAEINEGETATFTVTLSGGQLPQETETTVNYRIAGTVTATDYEDQNAGMLVFSSTLSYTRAQDGSFQYELPLVIRALADGTQEESETLTIEIITVAGAARDAAAGRTASVTIRASAEAAHTVSVSAPTARLSEGGSATFTTLTFNIAVSSTRALNNVLRVRYRLSGTADSADDYNLQPPPPMADTADIPLSGNTARVPIVAIADRANEDTETIVMTLVEVTPLNRDGSGNSIDASIIGGVGISSANREATVRLEDNNPLTVSVTRDREVLNEPTMDAVPGAGNRAVFTVSIADGMPSTPISAPTPYMSSAPVRVPFSISGDVEPSDYDVMSSGLDSTRSTLIIPAGIASGTLTVTARQDSLNEPQECLTLTLTGATSAGMVSVNPTAMSNNPTAMSARRTCIAANTGTTGPDGSPGPSLAVFAASAPASVVSGDPPTVEVPQVAEGTDIVFFGILTVPSSEDVSVMYEVTTSVPNVGDPDPVPDFRDLNPTTGMFTIPAGRRSHRVPVRVLQDQIGEPAETLTFGLRSAMRGTSEVLVDNDNRMALATIPRNAAHVREVRVTLPPYPPPPEMLEAPSLTYMPAPVAEGAAAVFRFEVVSPGNRTPLHTVPLTVCYDLEPDPESDSFPPAGATGGARGAEGTDYVLPTANAPEECSPVMYSIAIRPGQRVATLRVATVNDNEAEQNETFGLRIRSVVEASVDLSGMTASSNTTFAMATIEDDDGVRLSLSGPSRVAEGGRAEVEVRLGGGALAPAAYPVTVTYTINVDETRQGTTTLVPGLTDDMGNPVGDPCGTDLIGTLSFTADSLPVQAIPDLCLSSSDNIPEAAENDFIVISLSNAQRTDRVPNTIMIENPPEAPLRIRITDEADDPRLRAQRLEVAGAMLTRAAMILAIPTISRRLDPDSGALAPGLALTVGGRQVVAGGGKEGVAPVPFTGIGIVMPAQSPTPRQLLNMPADGDDGGAALQGLEGIVIAAASANDGLSPRQLLGDSGFALAQGEAGARTGTVIWGRGGYTKLEGEPVIGGELADYKGDAWTFYLGADRRYGNFLIGMAAGYTHGDLELDANILPGLPGTSTFEQDMISIVPYAAWQPSRAVSVWVLGGYGRGEVDIIEQEAGGTRREGASDSDLVLGAAGLTLRRPSQTPVDILLRLSTTAAQGTIEGGRLTGDSTVPPGKYGETTTNAQQVQAELELAGRFGAMAGTHVRPFLLLGAAQDFGDAAPNAVTGELGGGFDLLWPKLGLESNLKLQARITNKDGQISRRKYKEYLLTGGLRYDFGNDRRGLMLSLQPEFGATANTHALAGGAAIADAAAGALRRSLRRSLHGELAYGIGDARFWGTPGIVTIYGNGDVSGRQRQYGSGLRFEARRFALSAGAKRTRRSDGRPGYEFLLDGEYSF